MVGEQVGELVLGSFVHSGGCAIDIASRKIDFHNQFILVMKTMAFVRFRTQYSFLPLLLSFPS